MYRGCYTYDIESDGLWNTGGKCSGDMTEIFCVVLLDHTDESMLHNDIHTGFDIIKERISTARMLVCHNEIDFDLQILKHFFGVEPPSDCIIIDTLVWSRALFPDRKRYDGLGHGLEAWGERNGIPKPPLEDYSVYTPDTLHRCYEDVKNNHVTFKKLLRESQMYNSGPMLRLEQDISKIISLQCRRGHNFDKTLAEWLVKELTKWLQKIDEALRPYTPIRVIKSDSCKAVYKINGELRADILKYWKKELEEHYAYGPLLEGSHKFFGVENPDEEKGLYCRVSFEEFNYNSNTQMVSMLTAMGWEPLTLTKTGLPQITEESLTDFSRLGPVPKQLIKRRMVSSRLSMVTGWLRDLDDDGRIRGRVNPQGAVTLRMTHQKVVNVPKYAADERYSEFYRQCFITTKDSSIGEWSYERCDVRKDITETVTVSGCMAQVGCDAKGIENRMLANRMNDPKLTKIICDPKQDFHTVIWNTIRPYMDSRGNTKNLEYAFFYGAQDYKLGTMCDHVDEISEEEAVEAGYWKIENGRSAGLWKCEGAKATPWRGCVLGVTGQRVRARIMKGLPSLKELNDKVIEVSKQGHLVGFDGRRLIMRTGFDHQVETHKALNTLLQGDGALIMKQASHFLNIWLKREGIVAYFLMHVHDEIQMECYPSDRLRVAFLMRQGIIKAGEFFNLNCPLDAESKIGICWGDCH